MHERAHRTILRAQKPVHANIKFVEPWVWNIAPLEMKCSGSVEIFKTKIQIGELKIVIVTYVRPR